MSDLKEFLGKLRHDFVTDNQSNRDVNYFEKELGLFFWEEFVRILKELKYTNEEIKRNGLVYLNSMDLKWINKFPSNPDRLVLKYCVDCLGSEKVKELIKGVGENGK